MKGKVLMIVMMGLVFLYFLSGIAEAVQGGMLECTTELAVCNTNLTNAQSSLGMCNTDKANAQTNLSTCQANLAASQANLATCQANTVPPPSWYQKLPCDSTSNCPRFEVLADWNNEAVLDKETGLVWEQSPSTDGSSWGAALIRCNKLTTGGRLGWRLPMIEELASLVDPSSVPILGYALPSGHPFSNVQSSFYWSATTDDNLTSARVVDLIIGDVGNINKGAVNFYRWCVRGGQGVDPQ